MNTLPVKLRSQRPGKRTVAKLVRTRRMRQVVRRLEDFHGYAFSETAQALAQQGRYTLAASEAHEQHRARRSYGG